jgi:hypothetical protein
MEFDAFVAKRAPPAPHLLRQAHSQARTTRPAIEGVFTGISQRLLRARITSDHTHLQAAHASHRSSRRARAAACSVCEANPLRFRK